MLDLHNFLLKRLNDMGRDMKVSKVKNEAKMTGTKFQIIKPTASKKNSGLCCITVDNLSYVSPVERATCSKADMKCWSECPNRIKVYKIQDLRRR